MNQPVIIPVYARLFNKTGISHKDIGPERTKSIGITGFWTFLTTFIFLWLYAMTTSMAFAAEMRVVVLGDSLTAGYGLEGGQAFPDKLQISLQKEGLDVQVDNAGVSGDTTAGGLSRLDWAIQGDQIPNLVVVALGANDMLRGLSVTEAQRNLSAILKKLKDQKIPTLLAGMKAPGQYSLLFRGKFEEMYADLADEYDVSFYPFFLEGVALHPDLNQPDGIHPNEKGVDVMVKNMTPVIKDLLIEK